MTASYVLLTANPIGGPYLVVSVNAALPGAPNAQLLPVRQTDRCSAPFHNDADRNFGPHRGSLLPTPTRPYATSISRPHAGTRHYIDMGAKWALSETDAAAFAGYAQHQVQALVDSETL